MGNTSVGCRQKRRGLACLVLSRERAFRPSLMQKRTFKRSAGKKVGLVVKGKNPCLAERSRRLSGVCTGRRHGTDAGRGRRPRRPQPRVSTYWTTQAATETLQRTTGRQLHHRIEPFVSHCLAFSPRPPLGKATPDIARDSDICFSNKM